MNERGNLQATFENTNEAFVVPSRHTNKNYEISAFQGIHSEIAGLRYFNNDWWLDNVEAKKDLLEFNGYFSNTITQLHMDLDHDECGLPDIIVNISQPQILTAERFLRLASGRKNETTDEASDYLKKRLSVERPVEIYEWQSEDQYGSMDRQFMELWLMTFDITIETLPSPTHRKQRKQFHRIFGDKLSDGKEYDNQRHKPFDILIKLSPDTATTNYYQGRKTTYGGTVKLDTVKFGIGGVEILDSKYNGEKEVAAERGNIVEQRIGAFVPRGLSYALFKDLNSIPHAQKILTEEGQEAYLKANITSQSTPFYNLNGQPRNQANEQRLFNTPRYIVIHISNIGSWREGNWFTDLYQTGRKYADRVHVTLAIYVFVKGDWLIKKPVLTEGLEPNAIFDQPTGGYVGKVWSVFKKMLPSFNLGFFGKVVSLIILLILIIIFVPGLLTLVNVFLKKIANINKSSNA